MNELGFPKPSPRIKTKKRLSKVRKTTKAQMKEKAWKMCSRYIRLKDVDLNGNNTCYTCSSMKPYKQMQAGHGIAGRGNAILFVEDILRPQCVGCNIFQHGRHDVFVYKLTKELGQERMDYLMSLKHTTLDYTKEDYEELYERYKRLVENLL